MAENEKNNPFHADMKSIFSDVAANMLNAVRERDREKVRIALTEFKQQFFGNDVLWANEVGTNYVLNVLNAALLIILTAVLLAVLGISGGSRNQLLPILLLCQMTQLIALGAARMVKKDTGWLKYLLLYTVTLTIGGFHALVGYRITLALVIPVVISVRYLSWKCTAISTALSGMILVLSTVAYGLCGLSVDINDIVLAENYSLSAYLHSLLLHSCIPNLLLLGFLGLVCMLVARWGHHALAAQERISSEYARVNTELNLAKEIQTSILPTLYPAFPTRPEFDVIALMEPAKELGGDFYDYFLIDEDHLALVIADVSGKGVPAALFMMIGKVIIKNQSLPGRTPKDILEQVSNQLCENNSTGLFITAWMGILEISTGVLTAVNAGHEYPMLMRKGEEYVQLHDDKHGFVLAGMEDIHYRNYEIRLQPGDRLFVYTDGIPEASNSDEVQFGTENLLTALNDSRHGNQEQLLEGILEHIGDFVMDAPQFDDMTMMALEFRGAQS